jgi:hypothetical protein
MAGRYPIPPQPSSMRIGGADVAQEIRPASGSLAARNHNS